MTVRHEDLDKPNHQTNSISLYLPYEETLRPKLTTEIDQTVDAQTNLSYHYAQNQISGLAGQSKKGCNDQELIQSSTTPDIDTNWKVTNLQ